MGIRGKSARRSACIFGLVVVLVIPALGLAGERVPGDHWMRYADVGEAGFDPAKLEAAKKTWEGNSFRGFFCGCRRPRRGSLGRRR